MAEANTTLLVANDNEGCETKAAATLYDLSNAIDMYELVDETVVPLFAVTALSAVPTFLCHILSLFFSGDTDQ
jgi:hypothetical protein